MKMSKQLKLKGHIKQLLFVMIVENYFKKGGRKNEDWCIYMESSLQRNKIEITSKCNVRK